MAIPRPVASVALAFLFLGLGAQVASGDPPTAIYSFGSLSNATGDTPLGPLTQGPDGALYGTCSDGEGEITGAIFKIQPDGSGFTKVRYFTNFSTGPIGRLALAGNKLYGTAGSAVFAMNLDGSGFEILASFNVNLNGLILAGKTLYGMTMEGGTSGSGTIFSINIDGGDFTTLHDFSALDTGNLHTNTDGAQPQAGLLLMDGTLYGTTTAGGFSGYGTVFAIETNGADFRTLHTISGYDGVLPLGELLAVEGKLYGTTSEGNGTVFSLNTDGTGHTNLHYFDGGDDGSSPKGGLCAVDGLLYGTTEAGGPHGTGTLFSMHPDGSGFAVLADSFNEQGWKTKGSSATLALSGNKFYGTAEFGGAPGVGSVFAVDINEGVFSNLIVFRRTSPSRPAGSLALSGNTLYGMTSFGGANNYGTVFSLSTNGASFTDLHDFVNTYLTGTGPVSGLILDGGALFGTTSYSEIDTATTSGGVVFSMSTNGAHYNEEPASSQISWLSAPVVSSGGTLFGTAEAGGSFNYGVVFSLAANGADLTNLHSFTAPGSQGTNFDGAEPGAAVILAGSRLYGTTSAGGATGEGTIFAMETNGDNFQTLHSFDHDWPSHGSLVCLGDTLYGTTCDKLFAMQTNGTGYRVLQHFSGTNGWSPIGSLCFVNNTLIGATESGGTNGCGTVFAINPDGSGYISVSLDFANGAQPSGGLVVSGETLYGLARFGGSFGGGTVFKFPLAPHFLTEPVGLVAARGQTLALTGVASGPGLSYQWLRNSEPLTNNPAFSGTTSNVLTLHHIATEAAASYSLVASNVFGFVISSNVAVVVEAKQRPVITITSPAPSHRSSHPAFTGVVTDPAAGVQVHYWFTNESFSSSSEGLATVEKETSTRWKWTIAAVPGAGSNSLVVQANDTNNIYSIPAKTSFFYEVVAPLTLTLDTPRMGTVRPIRSGPGALPINGANLYIGQAYHLVAQPRAGFIFAGWTGDIQNASSDLNFVMARNLLLQANFATNPFSTLAGMYSGLFYDLNNITPTNAGYVSIKVTPQGGYSGLLLFGPGQARPFSGHFTSVAPIDLPYFTWAASADTLVYVGGLALGISLRLYAPTPATEASMGGSVMAYADLTQTETSWPRPINLQMERSQTPTNAVTGRYNFVGVPPLDYNYGFTGLGFGTAILEDSGRVRTVMHLADGQSPPLTLSTTVGKDGAFPIYSSLYDGKGVFLGWLRFTNDTTTFGGARADLESVIISWIQEPGVGKGINDGFSYINSGAAPFIFGSRYIPPRAGTNLFGATNLLIEIDVPDLAAR